MCGAVSVVDSLSCKGDYNHDFWVISVPSSWQLDRYSWALHPGVTGEGAWSAFQRDLGYILWLCCRTPLLWIRKRGNSNSQPHFSWMRKKRRKKKKPWMYPCIRHIYSHTCCLAHTHTHTPVQSVIPCREMIEKRKLTTQMESPSQVEMFWSLFGSKSKPKSFKVLSRSLTVGLCVINVAGCGGNLWLVGGRVLNGEWNHLLIQLSLQHSGFFFVCCLSFSDVGGEQQVYGQRFLSWLTRFLYNSFSQLWSR